MPIIYSKETSIHCRVFNNKLHLILLKNIGSSLLSVVDLGQEGNSREGE
jgi:hypothetical protein